MQEISTENVYTRPASNHENWPKISRAISFFITLEKLRTCFDFFYSDFSFGNGFFRTSIIVIFFSADVFPIHL